MRAWAIDAYGEPMRVMELPVPTPGPNDVLIRMHGAEVGDWDEAVRTGEWPMEHPFPLALGLAGFGVVASVGKDVTRVSGDDRVYAYSYPLYNNGAWAEYMLVPESYVAVVPPALDLVRMGAVPIAALTAHEALFDVLDVRKGDVVLVTAASGGVGHFAVQIAASLGAHVIASTSRHNYEFVRELGAERVIDYTSEDVERVVRATYPDGVDKVLNGVAGPAANSMVGTLRDGGHMVDLPGSITAKRPGIRVDSDFAVHADGARLGLIAGMVDDGLLRVEIEDIIPFDRARKALDKVLTKHVTGKIGLHIH
jgi:NADPH:quinone reductase-like Zn-dependent oxidoreductase